VQTAEDYGVLIHFLLFDALNRLFQEAQLLILLVFTLTLTKRIILGHALKEILIDQGLHAFEVELVSVVLTNLFPCVLQRVEESLENAGHLHDVQVFHV